MPPAISHVKRPGSPFAARGKDVQLLGLDDAVLDVGHHHLRSSGRRGQEKDHDGPRHAI